MRELLWNPGPVLFPIDRDVLAASHTVIRPVGTRDEAVMDLGAWTETSTHLFAEIESAGGNARFGARTRNGFTQPWLEAPAPPTALEDNPALTGTATWRGHLLGLSETTDAVAGNAALELSLDTLTGTLAFTELEYWAGTQPQAAGTGSPWGPETLGYQIAAAANRFVHTGGDDGTVTGVFAGTSHEIMGGTLERADLTASFAGTR